MIGKREQQLRRDLFVAAVQGLCAAIADYNPATTLIHERDMARDAEAIADAALIRFFSTMDNSTTENNP